MHGRLTWCALALGLLGAGCGGSSRVVDLTIAVDSALPPELVASLVRLDLEVDGAERAQASYPLTHPFASGRQERVVYHPLALSGALGILAIARDQAGMGIAGGETQVVLPASGAVSATVILTTDGPGTGGSDLGPSDLGISDLASPDFAGACAGLDAGALCGAGDACHLAATCQAGVCTPHPLADGTVCDATRDACKSSGTCHAGVCGPIGNQPAGTVCSPKSNACHTDGVCDGKGECGSQGVRPDGYNWNPSVPLDRCCGGSPVAVNTTSNCGACGIDCNGGSCVAGASGYLYCTCTSNTQCWSKCCSVAYGTPLLCAAGNCATNQPIACPGNASNTRPANDPYACHY